MAFSINVEVAENPIKSRHITILIPFFMPVFECILKQDRAGMRKGTTIHVSTSLSSCDDYKIADECERLYGKKARDASFHGYWDIRKIR